MYIRIGVINIFSSSLLRRWRPFFFYVLSRARTPSFYRCRCLLATWKRKIIKAIYQNRLSESSYNKKRKRKKYLYNTSRERERKEENGNGEKIRSDRHQMQSRYSGQFTTCSNQRLPFFVLFCTHFLQRQCTPEVSLILIHFYGLWVNKGLLRRFSFYCYTLYLSHYLSISLSLSLCLFRSLSFNLSLSLSLSVSLCISLFPFTLRSR